MRIFILKPCLSEGFAFFMFWSNGMKAGWVTLFFIATAIFAVVILAEEEEDVDGNHDRFPKASCNFTLNFLKHYSAKYNSSNIIFSPASISTLLAILQQGAKGNTLLQLQQVLSLTPHESKEVNDITELKKRKNVELKWGNRCYIRKGLELSRSFEAAVKESFGVGIEELDFNTVSPKENAYKINQWVSKVTHYKINNFIDSSKLGPNMVMLLINAIFFKGNWLRPFKRWKTFRSKFELTDEKSTETYFMVQKGKYNSDKDTFLGAKFIQLPFQNRHFAMVFVVPTRRHRLDQLLDRMTADDLYQIFIHRDVAHVKLRVPKFKLSETVSLVEILKELGLTDIFSEASDLTGITQEKLQVSEIIHKADVEIDERGSTSSAATAVEFLRMRPPSFSFIADQPFLFFIVDTERKIPLFAGKVANPQP